MGIMENFRRTAVTDSVITTTLSNNNRTPAEGALDEKHTHEQETDEESLHKDHKLVVDDKERAQIDNEEISEGAQAGVKAVEAITSVWGKKSLWAAYILIFLINFIDAMQQGTTGLLTPYVTSNFAQHSLTAATYIMSSIIGGLFKLPLAKLIDIWGRPQGYALMVFFMTIGLIMMAACNSVTTFAAAQVFYWVGYNGVSYVLGVFVADTSSLRNRGFMFAFTSSPYIATVWITGPLSQAFLNGPGWRWCFGAFSIITPVISAPLYALFQYNYWKADKAGLVPKRPASGRTFAQSVWYYVVQFDLFGILLICAGLALFLLPFSLYSYQADGWKSPMIICMIIFGGLLCIAFVIWEKYFAPVTFVPYHLLMDRTVLGACILAAVLFVEFYIWDTYFSSMLQVVYDQNLTTTGYIVNIYSIGSCFWSLVVGLWIRYTGKFKWVALWCGLPLTILGVALMIAFRQPDVNIGYIVMCQIFIAFGGGTLVICEQIAVMAVTSHQYVAVVLAIEGMFSSIGGAIGSAVAAAIWTGVFPGRLERYLPEEEQENLALIVGDITAQMGFPVGTPARDAVNRAYGDAQRYMLISASCVLVIAVAATLVWRNVNVKNFKQVKGTVA